MTETMLQKLRDFYDSPEGQEHLKVEREKIRKRRLYKDRWITKISEWLTVASDEQLSTVFESFCAHNKKQSDIKWKHGIDGESDIATWIFDAFSEIGYKNNKK